MKKLVASGFFFSLLAMSCQKQDDVVLNIQNTDIPLIISEMFGEDLGWIYTYNEWNLPLEVKTKWSYQKFFYNDNNEIEGYDLYEDPGMYSSVSSIADSAMHRKTWVNPENSKRSAYARFYYEKGRLRKKTILNNSGCIISTMEYEYSADGKIFRNTYDSGYTEYSYDEAGNLVQRKQYFNGKLLVLNEYDFDDHPNPFIVFRGIFFPGRYTNTNNIIREKQTLYDGVGEIDNAWTEEWHYDYNDSGYPVKVNDMVTYEYR